MLLPLNLAGGLDTLKNSVAASCEVDMNPFHSSSLPVPPFLSKWIFAVFASCVFCGLLTGMREQHVWRWKPRPQFWGNSAREALTPPLSLTHIALCPVTSPLRLVLQGLLLQDWSLPAGCLPPGFNGCTFDLGRKSWSTMLNSGMLTLNLPSC